MTAEERWAWAKAETANLLGRVNAGADLEQQIAEALNAAKRDEQDLVNRIDLFRAAPAETPLACLTRLLGELQQRRSQATVSGPIAPSELLIAVQSWSRLVDQLAPYAGPNEDPGDVLTGLLCELRELRAEQRKEPC